MTWSERGWEFTVTALSWFIAIGALAFVVMFVMYDAYTSRRKKARR